MLTVAYVVVDDETLFFYNEMMKSLLSLRLHNPELRVCVFTDDRTYKNLKTINAEVFKMAEVISVEISDKYTQIEKSRFLKVTLRDRLSGVVLYMDTDTVICDEFPSFEMQGSIGMVLEFHSLRNDVDWYLTDIHDAQCGFSKNEFDYYFNGGVVLSKDDNHAHRFYQKWYELWEQSRQNGCSLDQPSLNYIVIEEINHIEILDGVWNCQLARAFSFGLNYLSDAHIIHYFNMRTSAYKFCQDEYRRKKYNDPVILEMLQNPKKQFSRARLVKLDDSNQMEGCNLFEMCNVANTNQFKLLEMIVRHKQVNFIIEKILGVLFKFRRLIIARMKKS